MQDLESTQFFKVESEPETGVSVVLSTVYRNNFVQHTLYEVIRHALMPIAGADHPKALPRVLRSWSDIHLERFE